jgi:beta-lactam-binding protein with PASTA domain/serine/threonine protein kinase
MATSADDTTRTIAGRYRLGPTLGAGAHSKTFDAVDLTDESAVVVRLLPSKFGDAAGFMRRFDEDMRIASELDHPNIARIRDYGSERVGTRNYPFVVTDQLAGGTLRGILDRGRQLSASQALLVGIDVCRGLAYAHSRGLIHGSVSPGNLIFGADRKVRIADFGIARLMGLVAWSQPERVDVDVARYASPEHAQGLPLDPKSDVYSLAITLVESATGQVPFASDTAVATLMARVDRLLRVSADLGDLALVLERAGRPVVTDRYSAVEFGKALVATAALMPRPEPIPIVGLGRFGDTTANLPRISDSTVIPEIAGTAGAGIGAAAGLAARSALDAVAARPESISPAPPEPSAEPEPDARPVDTAEHDVAPERESDVPTLSVIEPTIEPVPEPASPAPSPPSRPHAVVMLDDDDDGDDEAVAPVAPRRLPQPPTLVPDLTTMTPLPTTEPPAAHVPAVVPIDEDDEQGVESALDVAGAPMAASDDVAREMSALAEIPDAPGHPVDAPLPEIQTSSMPALVDAVPIIAPAVDAIDEPEATVVIDAVEPVDRSADVGFASSIEPVVVADEPTVAIEMPLTPMVEAAGADTAPDYVEELPESWAPYADESASFDEALDVEAPSRRRARSERRASERSGRSRRPAKTSVETTPVAPADDIVPSGRIETVEGDDDVLDIDGRSLVSYLLVALAFVVVAVVGVVGYRTLATPSHTVPDLTGMAEEQAANQVASYGWRVLPQHQRDDTRAQGLIVRTDPPAGAKLNKGGTLVVVISDGPSLTTLPEITGLTEDAARSRLAGLGLSLRIAKQVASETVPDGQIISWSIGNKAGLQAGNQVPKGTTVDATVSTGPAPRTVPTVAGVAYDQARKALTDAGFIVGNITQNFDSTVPSGVVISSSPAGGTTQQVGTSIDLVVSKGPDQVVMPNIIGKDLKTVNAALTAVGLTLGTTTGNSSTGVAKSAQYPAGTLVDRGASVAVTFG